MRRPLSPPPPIADLEIFLPSFSPTSSGKSFVDLRIPLASRLERALRDARAENVPGHHPSRPLEDVAFIRAGIYQGCCESKRI